MKDEEKNLIENLFHRLKNIELNSSERDSSADSLIQKLVQKQLSSSYYMVQTILVQETAIKKMSGKIEELEKRITMLKRDESNKKPSFLSNFFKTNADSQITSHDNNIWKNKDTLSQSHNATISPATQTLPTATAGSTTTSGGFLSNALQTATGVAGGMILGNMLMNVFNHTKPEEEIFDTINKSSTEHNTEESAFNNDVDHHNLVNYEYNESNSNSNELNSDIINNDMYETDETDDINDDNFI